jgi:hypothetical protein
MEKNKSKNDDKYSLDWLGCDGCAFNQGKPGWPVCDHPTGVRFVFGNKCMNCIPKMAINKFLTKYTKRR